MISFDNNKPIYIQIAEDIADRIVLGQPAAEERIPSIRDLAANYQVNANTAMRSVEHLQSEGIIYNRRGIGYFVAAEAKERIIEMRRQQFMTTEIDYFFSRLAMLGYTPDEVKELYQNYIYKKTAK